METTNNLQRFVALFFTVSNNLAQAFNLTMKSSTLTKQAGEYDAYKEIFQWAELQSDGIVPLGALMSILQEKMTEANTFNLHANQELDEDESLMTALSDVGIYEENNRKMKIYEINKTTKANVYISRDQNVDT